MFYKELNNGLELPAVGLGTWQITDRRQMETLIGAAYSNGYRLFDTASAYSNEIALAKALGACAVPREDIFLSDKAWNTSRGFDAVQEACRRSLKKLKTDYLDLYLIHWPASPKLHENWKEINAETWRGMEELYRQGFVRAIGVCNFKQHHLEALLRAATIIPMVNQIEFHPGLPQTETVDYCQDNGILVEASSPLGNGKILENSTLRTVASAAGKTAAQVCLRWALQKNALIIPKTSNQKRLVDNISVFDFELTLKQMEQIDQIPFCGGLAIDPDEVTEFG